jgi:hypothetical protein
MAVFAILATYAFGWKKGVGAEYRIVDRNVQRAYQMEY